jgi:hypothetical protein
MMAIREARLSSVALPGRQISSLSAGADDKHSDVQIEAFATPSSPARSHFDIRPADSKKMLEIIRSVVFQI